MLIIMGGLGLFIFGFLWYGPVFGKQWMALMKMTPEQIAEGRKQPMTTKIVIAVVLALATSAVVYCLEPQLLSFSFGQFLKSILLIWLGFNLPLIMNGYLWEGRSLKLTAFNGVANVLSLMFLSAIIYFW